MKKTILTLTLLLIILLQTTAQNTACKFFTTNGSKVVTEVKCNDLSDLIVTVPIPANVGDYDNFALGIKLSHMTSTADISFLKDDIKSKLIGKKEITLTVLGANGKSDFKYGHEILSLDHFCKEPREKLLDKITATVVASGYKILKYNKETRYDEYKSAWITEEVPVWDNGVKSEFTNNVITVYQKALTEGIQDEKGVFTANMKNTDKSKYYYLDGSSKDYEGCLVIEDNSLAFPVKVVFLYFKSDLQSVKTDMLNILKLSTLTSCKYSWRYYYTKRNGSLSPDNRAKFNDEKPKDFAPVTLGGKEFASLPYFQKAFFEGGSGGSKLMPGMLLDFYVIESSPYTLVACGVVMDDIKSKSVTYSQPPMMIKDDLFSFRMKPEDLVKAQEIIKAIVGSVKFTNK